MRGKDLKTEDLGCSRLLEFSPRLWSCPFKLEELKGSDSSKAESAKSSWLLFRGDESSSWMFADIVKRGMSGGLGKPRGFASPSWEGTWREHKMALLFALLRLP